MKKIALISNNDNIVFYFRREIVEAFLQKGYFVYLITPVHGHLKRFEGEDNVEIIPIELERRGTNPLSDLKLFHLLLALLKEKKPDIVFTYTIKPNLYGSLACKKLKIPCFPNITGLGDAMENSGILRYLVMKLSHHCYKHDKGVFLQNQANRSFFVENKIIKEKQIRMLPGSGVNLTRFKYIEYPSEKDGVRLLFVGRLIKDKGLFEFLEATQHYMGNKKLSFSIAGSLDDSDYYVPRVLERYNVTYLGLLPNPQELYSKYHVIVLPSYHEGMSNVLLEAAATGRPLITSNVPGCQETFEEGVSGFGCEPKDTDSLIKAIDRFLLLSEEEHVKLGEAGRKKMEKEFSRDLVVKEYMQTVLETIGE